MRIKGRGMMQLPSSLHFGSCNEVPYLRKKEGKFYGDWSSDHHRLTCTCCQILIQVFRFAISSVTHWLMVYQIKSILHIYCFQIQVNLLSLLRPPVTSPKSDKICILPFVVDYRSCRQRSWQGYHVENNISSSLWPICNVLFTPLTDI